MATRIFERLRALCLSLPETEEKEAWGAPTYRARGKLFAMFANNHHNDHRVAVWCKAPRGAQQMLVPSNPEILFVPPYVGPDGWIGVRLDKKPDWNLVRKLLEDGHREALPKRAAPKAAAAEGPAPASAPSRDVDRPCDPPRHAALARTGKAPASAAPRVVAARAPAPAAGSPGSTTGAATSRERRSAPAAAASSSGAKAVAAASRNGESGVAKTSTRTSPPPNARHRVPRASGASASRPSSVAARSPARRVGMGKTVSKAAASRSTRTSPAIGKPVSAKSGVAKPVPARVTASREALASPFPGRMGAAKAVRGSRTAKRPPIKRTPTNAAHRASSRTSPRSTRGGKKLRPKPVTGRKPAR